jgi:hypothetical protein
MYACGMYESSYNLITTWTSKPEGKGNLGDVDVNERLTLK